MNRAALHSFAVAYLSITSAHAAMKTPANSTIRAIHLCQIGSGTFSYKCVSNEDQSGCVYKFRTNEYFNSVFQATSPEGHTMHCLPQLGN